MHCQIMTYYMNLANIRLNISIVNLEQCIASSDKKGGGTSLYIPNVIRYKKIMDLSKINYMNQYLLGQKIKLLKSLQIPSSKM